MSMNPVVHFEMPYKDMTRVMEFYKKAFGWEMTGTGEDMGNYILAGTADTDANQMVLTPGTINGGFYPLSDPQGSATYVEPSVVISVDNLKQAMEDIKAAGGEVIREPQEIPGIGLWASFKDSEGNRASVLQPSRK